MAAKAGDKVYGSQWCDCMNKNVLAVPWNLPATVKWQRRLVGCSVGDSAEDTVAGCSLRNLPIVLRYVGLG